MSSQSHSSSSYSSSSSSSTVNGQTTGSHTVRQSHTDLSGTTVQTTSQNLGGPATQETRHYDASGHGLSAGVGNGVGTRLVEDAQESDTDRLYRERMEDEYAKREGGA